MEFQFGKGVYERDIDLLLMRRIATDKEFVRKFFLSGEKLAEKGYDKADFTVEEVAHSVWAVDGESDVEAILSIGDKRIALLIEDKINAPAMKEQSDRYNMRGDEAKSLGKYDEYYVFIVAPGNYIDHNMEAKKYNNKIKYQELEKYELDDFEKAIIKRAYSKDNTVRLARDQGVTEFWNKLYDFVEREYPNRFKLPGHPGLERSGKPNQWITMIYNNRYTLEIKSDRGYVDLEINGYGDKFEQFSKDNRDVIDARKLYVRAASKSLAIRKYINSKIDFTEDFNTQETALREAFDAAKELLDLIPWLKIR